MKKDDLCYGVKDQEVLDASPDDTVDNVLFDACEKVGEGFDAMADRVSWPIRIRVFRRMDIGGDVRSHSIAARIIEDVLGDLDSDYGNHDSDHTEPTDQIKTTALEFGRAVVADYIPWACEPTGEVIEYTREQAKREEKCVHNNAVNTKETK